MPTNGLAHPALDKDPGIAQLLDPALEVHVSIDLPPPPVAGGPPPVGLGIRLQSTRLPWAPAVVASFRRGGRGGEEMGPVERSGLVRTGDVVSRIDGECVLGLGFEEVVGRIGALIQRERGRAARLATAGAEVGEEKGGGGEEPRAQGAATPVLAVPQSVTAARLEPPPALSFFVREPFAASAAADVCDAQAWEAALVATLSPPAGGAAPAAAVAAMVGGQRARGNSFNGVDGDDVRAQALQVAQSVAAQSVEVDAIEALIGGLRVVERQLDSAREQRQQRLQREPGGGEKQQQQQQQQLEVGGGGSGGDADSLTNADHAATAFVLLHLRTPGCACAALRCSLLHAQNVARRRASEICEYCRQRRDRRLARAAQRRRREARAAAAGNVLPMPAADAAAGGGAPVGGGRRRRRGNERGGEEGGEVEVEEE